MYWLCIDSTIVHLSLFYKITRRNVQFYNAEHFASGKNQQWLKSIGKWLNKLWYSPPVVCIPFIRMKLDLCISMKICQMYKWKKQIAGQYKPNSVKNSNSNSFIYLGKCIQNFSVRVISANVHFLPIWNTLSFIITSMSMHYCDN